MDDTLWDAVAEVLDRLAPADDYLMVMNGPEDGRIFPLVGASTKLGRLDGCAVTLQLDPTISRDHADILRGDKDYYIEDHSRHGTVVDGTRISGKTLLHDGSMIQVGDTVLRICCGHVKE
jgi:pSer/pThr/pTyr-binding forkhead associated (FHA) protein